MKNKLAKILLKRLNETGFKSHYRIYEQPSHYGKVDESGIFIPDTDEVEEEWNNKDFINWLLDVNDKEISEDANKIREIFNYDQ